MGLKSMEDYTATTVAPLLLRNLGTSMFTFADKSLLNLSQKYKLLEIIRYLLVSSFLFFLRLLPSILPYFRSNSDDNYAFKVSKSENYALACDGDSGVSRALSQLLSIVGDIPVNSPKYQVVRTLAERLIDENHRENNHALHEVNRAVLTAAFSRTLGQLEAAVVEFGREQAGDGGGSGYNPVQSGLSWVMRAVRSVGEESGSRVGYGRDQDLDRCGMSAHKLAAELLWLAQKMSACGFGEEAVRRWATASNLAWHALSAEPRLQGSLIKVSAFLIGQAKEIGVEEEEKEEGEEEGAEEGKTEQQRQTKVKMLLAWLPLLCRGSNGVEVPVLSIRERAEVEKALEEIIGTLGQEDEQEQVLSLWLHHFTYSSSTDWPNLHYSYARWYTTSRKLLLLQ